MPMFSLSSLSTSETMFLRTCNSSNISTKMLNFTTASVLPIKVYVQALFNNETSSVTSLPAKFSKNGMQVTMTSHPGMKILKPLRASNMPVKHLNEINEKNQKFNNWKSNQLDSIVDYIGGSLVQNGLVYRQTILVRSFEIGSDGKISLGALTNHLQDTALNHARYIGVLADGFGSTPVMSRNDLIWVVSAMHIVVDRFPSWADVVQVDTWMDALGKNRLRRDWLVRDGKTGETLVRATSDCVIMNKKTRKLSKFTKEIREELIPYSIDCDPIINKDSRKLFPLDVNTADHVCMGLTPTWNDMDVNQHVSHVKYIDWILESTPYSFIEHHELSAMTLEYRKECDRDSVLQVLSKMVRNDNGNGNSFGNDVVEFDHLLHLEDGSVILRGRTKWKPVKR